MRQFLGKRGNGGMESKAWKKKIKKNCVEAGTYRPFFDDVIETLAQIMERRDDAREKFIATGGNTVYIHTNKAKEKNLVKHPALVVLMELDAQALAYWRDLGLTPAGLKKLNADVVNDKGAERFEKLLEKIV